MPLPLPGRDLSKILSGVLKASFGPGAIGRIGTVVIAMMVVLAVLAVLLAFVYPIAIIGVAVAVVGVVVTFMLLAFSYATKFPEFAAMDGSQIARVMIQDLAQKPLPGAPPIELRAAPIENPLLLDPAEPSRSNEGAP